MNVIFCIERFFPNFGGATVAAVNLARALRRRGVHVSFVVDSNGGLVAPRSVYDGFPVAAFSTGQPGKGRRLTGFLKLFAYLLAHRGQFDLFHIHGGNYITLAQGRLAQCLGTPALLKVTQPNWDGPAAVRGARYGRLARSMYRRLDGVVTMSTGRAADVRAAGFGGALAIIPNGVDCDRFQPLDARSRERVRRSLGLAPNRPVLAYAGVLGDIKGSDILFRVWDRVLASASDAALLCTGNFSASEGSGREAIRAYLAERNGPAHLADDPRLVLVGATDDMNQHLGAADMFLFPSPDEGFGTVQIEAMACGLPCVVNDIPGLTNDIFPDRAAGIRIPGNDVGLMTAAVLELIRDPHRRTDMGQAARKRAVEAFSIESVAERYEVFYRELIRSGSKGRQA